MQFTCANEPHEMHERCKQNPKGISVFTRSTKYKPVITQQYLAACTVYYIIIAGCTVYRTESDIIERRRKRRQVEYDDRNIVDTEGLRRYFTNCLTALVSLV